jgi:hypothetical protein
MIKNTIMKNTLKQDYRSLKKADGFYRAELKPNGYDLYYLVKLRKLKGNGVGFFIKQDSVIFNKLEAGKVLEMKYWTSRTTKTVKSIKVKVKNIGKQNRELLNGHYLVCISVLRV